MTITPWPKRLEYVDAIKGDVQWLGFDWEDRLFFASDYFGKLYEFAIQLIKNGKAYVDDQSVEEIRRQRGTLTEPGIESPCRNRSVEENLDLFERMRAGEFEDGSMVLRAKIDMASPNMNLRDPLIYRIRKVAHHRSGNEWCIYPLYDFTHPLSDMLEGITHSICTLEFQDHRPLYDWLLDELKTPCHPQQIEFARLNLNYTVLSKRRLLELVGEKIVDGWDDPRMPTIMGLRRRGYTPRAIRNFATDIGVTKKDTVIALSTLEHHVRGDLDETAPRVMCVQSPIKVVIENYEQDEEFLEAQNHPKKPEMGTRQVPFAKEVYIDADDFSENPPPKYHRLVPGGRVRLRYAYVIECKEVIKDDSGNVIELRCTYDPETKSGHTPDGQKKVKGIIHWVSAKHSIPCEVRLYDRLFTDENPGGHKDKDYKEFLNPNCTRSITNSYVEQSAKAAQIEDHFQLGAALGFSQWIKTANDKLVTEL
ncbi:MAG: glutamine--tRNA ligase [Bdellovibrionales bacterium]